MNKEQQLIIKENELFGEVRFITIEEKEYAVGRDIAEALGYKDPSATISKKCKNGLKTIIEAPCQNGNMVKTQVTLISEGDIYRLIIGSKLPDAEKFESWVMDEVLPEFRKHGAYISNNEDEVDQGYIKYTYGQLKNTFTNCPIETLIETYDDCISWHKKNKTRIPYAKNSKKRSDAKHIETDSRIKIMQKIVATLENRNVLLCEVGKFGLVSEIDNTIKQIKDDIKIQHNKSNGGKLSAKTKQINKLQDKLHNLVPSESEYITLNVHGYSHNAMYRHENGIGTVKTNGYNTWIQYFPRYEIPTREYYETNYNIDFTKPIAIYLKYVCKDSYDIRNLDKSTLDMIFNRVLNVDDNIVEYVSSIKVGSCKGYKDGKIIFAIRNL